MYKEALFWENTLGEKEVRCLLCARQCIIPEGKTGFCQVRLNKEGKLYATTYGRVAASSISLIEKKTMFHFFPGTTWLSVGSIGCNFHCGGCQSEDISQCDVKKKFPETTFVSPEMLVKKAMRNRCKGIFFTYNEPTMWFEYVLDVFKLAKEAGLSTCCATNGYMNSDALNMLAPHLDGLSVDVKGGSMEQYVKIADATDIRAVLNNSSLVKQNHAVHVEIITNIIPGYNSNEREAKEIAAWIFRDMGKETPWHLTRFFPYGKLKDVAPTPVGMLEKIHKLGVDEGLSYVFISNVPDHAARHTYCPKCKKIVIRREEFDEIQSRLKNGVCPHCKALIFGRFSL